jgi:hypothetical protein
MSMLNLDRAEYNQPEAVQPQTLDGNAGYVMARPDHTVVPKAIFFGIGGASAGAMLYALVGLTGFMVSIITVAIGYMVGRAMMTATGGYGDRSYQVLAVVLTYFGTTGGMLIDEIYHAQGHISPLAGVLILVAGPVLELFGNIGWGAIGLLILFYGLRAAWRIAAGTPGFGQPGAPRVGMGGIR